MGPTRSVRLPRGLDQWFLELVDRQPEASPSEVLVGLIHGGLRLRRGYMVAHRRVLGDYLKNNEPERYEMYCRCLLDTFGQEYVEHLQQWLAADGLKSASTSSSEMSGAPTDETCCR